MLNQYLVNILVGKIQRGDINPNTGKAWSVNDIVDTNYKTAVQTVLNPTT